MITYKKAGVDVEAGDALVNRIKKMSPMIGGFAGMVPLGAGYKSRCSWDVPMVWAPS